MSNIIEIRIPDIGDFDGVDVIEVLVAIDQQVAKEESLFTLESDKATMEIPSPESGVITELKIAVGDVVKEGDVVALLLVSAEADTSADTGVETEIASDVEPSTEVLKEEVETVVAVETATPTPIVAEVPKPTPVAASASSKAVTPAGGMAHASPAIRRFARELGANLNQIVGSARAGRITRDDVKAFVKQALTTAPATSGGSGMPFDLPPLRAIDFSKFGEIETQSLSRIQKLSGSFLARNWISIPHVTQFDEADITEMEAFRKGNQELARARGTKLTPLPFMIKACVAALKQFPQFNASLSIDGKSLVLKKYHHIGIAVDTDDGLVVPVLRNCDQKGLLELAEELAEVSQRARDGKLLPKDFQGGCFTISSLGGIGGTAFTPIINAPEVAILGVSRAYMKPLWNGMEFRPRLMLPLSLSYDHRVIDGASAARFTRYLAEMMADIRRVML
ncbi:MAG: dihydrolipoyllysine-residue acetyltransferase [Xanthomonadales bacterium]|nr:dihydrolipoyllysine-residue acetyltransferase [Xanthomonadales bacterium]